MEDEKDETAYLAQLSEILKGCLTGERSRHALLVVADDRSQTIAMYSANANDEFVTALLHAAKNHFELEEALGTERTRH